MIKKNNPAAVALGQIKSPKKSASSRKNGKSGGRSIKWRDASKILPKNSQEVVAIYKGVYGPRVVTFWRDGVNNHFGYPASQPATHWIPIPNSP